MKNFIIGVLLTAYAGPFIKKVVQRTSEKMTEAREEQE